MSRFNDFIKKHPPAGATLPLIHTTDVFSARDIIQKKELEPAQCPVFEESLLYFFYGRPAYRAGETKKATSQLCYMPVCFIFKPEAISSIKRILPFDSGAFEDKKYANYLHHKMNKEDFFLDISLDMAARIVSFFYGSNEKYYSGEVQQLEIPKDEFEVESYYQLISDRNKTAHDDRCASIEVQTDSIVKIIRDNILFVALPRIFLDFENIRRILFVEWNVSVETYEIYHGNALEYMSQLMKLVKDFFEKERILR